MSAAEVSTRLWERAFRLSYFILRDRSRAHECVARAAEKLAAQRTRERRRSYWRARKQELTIRRISRPAEDSLQWLVFLEAEAFEKEQESHGTAAEEDMIVRYIKHLAQLTTVNSSFHVNIGFNRLLRKYSTSEVQQIYELATRRYPGAEEYRKAKGKLLNQLSGRFERFLEVRTGQYGELQFAAHEDDAPWAALVEECLDFFTPWSSHTSCLHAGAALEAGPRVGGSRPAAIIPDRLETGWCHWFMHSTCYGRLAQQSGFDPPQERLSVPRFLHHDGSSRGSGPGSIERRAASLSQEESRILHERVAAAMAAGDGLGLRPFRIVAQGRVCGKLDPARNEQLSFEIADGTRLLELRSEAAGEDRILATHWIDYSEDGGIVAGEYTIALRGGRQLALSVVPRSQAGDGLRASAAIVTIESRASRSLFGWLGSFGSASDGRGALLRPALASVALVAVGALAAGTYLGFATSRDRHLIEQMAAQLAAQKAALVELERGPKPAIPSVAEVAHYAFSSDLPNLRGAGSAGEPVVSFAPADSMVLLQLPVSGGDGTYRVRLSSFPQDEERMIETALRPVKHGDQWIVEFALPAALVDGGSHYLLALTQGGADRGRYLFEVHKK